MTREEEKIIRIIDSHKDEIIAFASDIAGHPEPGFEEERTAAKTAAVLRDLGLEVHTDLGTYRSTRRLDGTGWTKYHCNW